MRLHMLAHVCVPMYVWLIFNTLRHTRMKGCGRLKGKAGLSKNVQSWNRKRGWRTLALSFSLFSKWKENSLSQFLDESLSPRFRFRFLISAYKNIWSASKMLGSLFCCCVASYGTPYSRCGVVEKLHTARSIIKSIWSEVFVCPPCWKCCLGVAFWALPVCLTFNWLVATAAIRAAATARLHYDCFGGAKTRWNLPFQPGLLPLLPSFDKKPQFNTLFPSNGDGEVGSLISGNLISYPAEMKCCCFTALP